MSTKENTSDYRILNQERCISILTGLKQGYGNQLQILSVIDHIAENPTPYQDLKILAQLKGLSIKVQAELKNCEHISTIIIRDRTTIQRNSVRASSETINNLLEEIRKLLLTFNQTESDLKQKEDKEKRKINRSDKTLPFQKKFSFLPFDEFKNSTERFLNLIDKEFACLKELENIIDYESISIYRNLTLTANQHHSKLIQVFTSAKEKGEATREERSDIHLSIIKTQDFLTRANDIIRKSI